VVVPGSAPVPLAARARRLILLVRTTKKSALSRRDCWKANGYTVLLPAMALRPCNVVRNTLAAFTW